MTRYYAEEPCEHGQYGRHWLEAEMQTVCPGGSRRELTIDYEAAAERFERVVVNLDGISPGDIRSIVDAALSGDPQ